MYLLGKLVIGHIPLGNFIKKLVDGNRLSKFSKKKKKKKENPAFSNEHWLDKSRYQTPKSCSTSKDLSKKRRACEH